jgi:hypothetical protein
MERLSTKLCAKVLNGSSMWKQHKRFFSDVFKEILVAGPD